MGPHKFLAVLILAVVAMMVVAPRVADAQMPSCATALAPCQSYFNLTGMPPESCCGPMAEAVKNQMECLCTLYATPGLLESFGITASQAMLLPTRCNIVTSSCSEGHTRIYYCYI